VRSERSISSAWWLPLVAFTLSITTLSGTDAQAQETSANEMARLSELIELGEKSRDVEQAIGAINEALRLADESVRWALQKPRQQVRAELHVALGRKYRQRREGVHADNLEEAIKSFRSALSTLTSNGEPVLLARAPYNLGVALADRIRGNTAENIEDAISAFQKAAAAVPKEKYPDQWIVTQRGMARAYQYRILGSRADNLERALAGYRLSLEGVTPQSESWARTQSYLGDLLVLRIRGDRSKNLEEAIVAYGAALTVRSRERFPELWASTQFGLGRAYADRLEGDRAENIEHAIKYFQAALSVRTSDKMPNQWAATKINLGNTYRIRVRGTFADNVELAIEAYRAALTIYTPKANPHRWAMARHILAAALSLRKVGDPAQNITEAIEAYRDALTVTKRQAYPRDHLVISRGLARALMIKREWASAREAYVDALESFRLMFAEISDDESEATSVISLAGPVFDEAAYVSAAIGDVGTAFQLLNEGKARLLSLALRDHVASLSTETRIQREKFAGEIQEWSRLAESIDGPQRVAAIEHAISLRDELHRLTKPSALTLDATRQNSTDQLDELSFRGRAIVAPIITEVGGKLIIVTDVDGSRSLQLLDFPDLTTMRLNQYLYGIRTDATAGWIGAYFVQYLAPSSQRTRIKEWRKAIEDVGPALWGLFVGRLDRELQRIGLKDGDQIIWMPTEALGLLPLGLARDTVTEREFGTAFEIVQAPSLDLVVSASRYIASPYEPSFAAILNPTGNFPELDLPFAEIEGRFAASRFAKPFVVELDQRNATPSEVLRALKDKTYWHFASHGKFDWKDARRSSLSLKDKSQLTIGELLQARGAVARPRLVVLSACETGLYDSRQNPGEFIGLPAAFMRLGSAGVLGTLWQVDDAATAFLMIKFYEFHLDRGLSPPAALKQAQAWLRTATKADLIRVAREAGKAARIDASKLAKLETLLKSRRRSGESLFSGLWNEIQSMPTRMQRYFQSRPFSHPYFWGGFVYTGL
jgi:CHAT domain-containing protein/tetratricopeptide (TPR) repeat protein